MALQQTAPQGTAVPQGTGQAILALQSGLAAKAVLRKWWRFDNLYPLLWRREWLDAALKKILSNDGSQTPGVDGIHKGRLCDPSARAQLVESIQKELRQKYTASPVLRKYVPKKSGGSRPIGIPTLKDRVVQMALKMVLEPIFEADFLPNSNGFRPKRSTAECVLPAYVLGNKKVDYGWVIEGDIKGCFDNIDHKILMKTVRKRITDKRILRLVWAFLKAPVVEDGVQRRRNKGTPQGGVLSPLLANIYLNLFDQYCLEHFEGRNNYEHLKKRIRDGANGILFRYADDFVFYAKGTEAGVVSIMNGAKDFLANQLRLELSPEKTRVVPLESGFNFLGFQIKRCAWTGHYSSGVRIRPTVRNVKRLRVKLHNMLGVGTDADDTAMKTKALNRVLSGWAHYYAKVNAKQQFHALDWFAERRFNSWYARRIGKGIRASLVVLKRKRANRVEGMSELFRMSSLEIPQISKKYVLCLKYKWIKNPYLTGAYETCMDDEEQPFVDPQEVHPANRNTYDEVYQINRLLAFDRDGWKCRKCPNRIGLIAHHVVPVPKGKFDPRFVHRVENLMTLCARCHRREHSKWVFHRKHFAK